MKHFIFIYAFVLTAPISAAAFDCGKSATIEVMAKKDGHSSNRKICVDPKMSWVLVEDSCGQDTAKCRKTLLEKAPPEETWPGQVGNPKFHLCTASGGIPEFVRWRNQKSDPWEKTTVCIFGKTFVDLDTLYQWWIDQPLKNI